MKGKLKLDIFKQQNLNWNIKNLLWKFTETKLN